MAHFKMVFEWRNEPYKSLYIHYSSAKYYLIDGLLRRILYTLPFIRPRRSWSLQKCMFIPYLRLWSPFGDVVQHVGNIDTWATHRAIPDSDSPVTAVWIDPAPAALTDEILAWARAAFVHPIRIPGYWMADEGPGTAEPAVPGEKVVYYIHGGGFISQSAHPLDFMSHIPRFLLRHSPATRAFAIEYRLTNVDPLAPPEERYPFPAALIDAIAGYVYLVDAVGVRPEDIILIGDSAGGNIALALARYIAENTAHLAGSVNAFRRRETVAPPDYHMILSSPWADLGLSHDYPGGSQREFYYDFIPDLKDSIFGHDARLGYCGPLGEEGTERNPYLSPASRTARASFKGFPRTFICAGDAERLYDQCMTLREKMRADCGEGRIASVVGRDSVHNIILMPVESVAAAQTWKAIEEWLEG